MTPNIGALLVLLSLAVPAAGSAQAAAAGRGGANGVRVHVGMWSTHLHRLRGGVDANWLVAVGWRGLYGGTFVNSFGNRAFAAGIERSFVRAEGGAVARGLGFRLGVVSGYDERLLGLAGKIPVLPALQVMGDVAMGRTGVELAWAGKVATISPFMRIRR
jgi:hypothetical protein